MRSSDNMLMLAAILKARHIDALTMDLSDDDDDTPQYRAPITYEMKNSSLPSLPSVL
ncbi:hypothetical protein L211DRAFT_523256 [Terfezia boudieri ATCC MYA-4762]|uniref:Uncharacterized protein n=1 Tax=Terfezia boudieri ATCC MYA-4762 TaxID=1051890 RepID=A0A3N4LIB4_9PEZI|nr:hypothetical protein L211DRAFT_523256 [Terfezia boudieri ATCC MYA-4762]